MTDNPQDLEFLRNYKPSIDDLKNKSPEKIEWSGKIWPEGREEIKSIEERISDILNLGENLDSVHYAPIMDRNQNEALRYLAKRLQILETIVKAYKTGKL